MKLSSKARYGLKACLALAENYNENQPLALPVFAEKAGVTEAYMEQIVILLKKADIVESVRGAGGGYYLKNRRKTLRSARFCARLKTGWNLSTASTPRAKAAKSARRAASGIRFTRV